MTNHPHGPINSQFRSLRRTIEMAHPLYYNRQQGGLRDHPMITALLELVDEAIRQTEGT